jgi:hypothetical protein
MCKERSRTRGAFSATYSDRVALRRTFSLPVGCLGLLAAARRCIGMTYRCSDK